MPIAISVVLLSVLPPVENSFESLPFVLATALLVAVVFFVFTRRLTFSVCCGWMVVGILSIISVIKFKNKGFSLHFYDMVFLDGDAVTFLFDSYPHLVLPVLLLMALLSYSAFIMYRLDRPRRLNGPKRILVLLAATVLLPLTFPADAYERQRHFYYLAGRHVTAFFVSLLDLEYMFVENELERRLSKLPPQAPFSGAAKCGDGDLPDIVGRQFILTVRRQLPLRGGNSLSSSIFRQQLAEKDDELSRKKGTDSDGCIVETGAFPERSGAASRGYGGHGSISSQAPIGGRVGW